MTLYQKLEEQNIKFESTLKELQGVKTCVYIVSDEDLEKVVYLNKDYEDEKVLSKTQAEDMNISKSRVAQVLKKGYGDQPPTREEFEELLRSKGIDPSKILPPKDEEAAQ